MIEVDVIVRSDAEVKFGGDVEQVRQYQRHLQARVDMRIVPFRPDMQLRRDAIVHYVNVDRPYDYLTTSELARGQRIVVSPIHHSLARVRMMRSAERGRGVRSAVDRMTPESLREWLASSVRNMRAAENARSRLVSASNAVSSLRHLPGLWRAVGRRLDSSAGVALLAPGEGRDLEIDTGWAGENASLIPNGGPAGLDSLARRSWAERQVAIVAVGRIEPRKRSLELATIAHSSETKVVFAGSLAEGSAYAHMFRELAMTSPFVDYRGALDHAAVLSLIADSRVLINASWVEVQSLVDLEAAHLGTRVISVPNGNSRDWLGRHVTYSEGYDLAPLLKLASVEAGSTEGPGLPDYPWSWGDSAESLLSLYKALV